ncbi:MAG TPA: hypothetical protein VFG35_30375 [Actinoplanes sp.]|nr:hypothetical protein [Actinoplanes sp.]
MAEPRKPKPQLVEEARRVPGGWVYEIDGDFHPDQRVPPEAIIGAWKVDDNGVLTGEYRPNPRYLG